jgi:uncharacterized membrane protein YhaH (DUF805 family)
MENQDSTVSENWEWVNMNIVWDKLTMKDRFLSCSSRHNRINRVWFIMNIIALAIIFWVIQSILKRSPDIVIFSISFIHLYTIVIQIVKRSHDFWKKWIITSIMAALLVLFPNIFSLFFQNPFEYITLMLEYYPLWLFIPFLYFIPLLVLAIIPWNKDDNHYGKSFWL